MRVLVIINKWWECDPALAAMLNDNTRPSDSPWPNDLKPARPRPEVASVENLNPVQRATFRYKNFAAEVWCVSDLLDGLSRSLQSSSLEKYKRLPAIFKGEKPGLVIAVGTASSPHFGVNCNGGVAVGTSVFMHDGRPDDANPDKYLSLPIFDQLVGSTITAPVFERIQRMNVTSVLNRFLPVPLNPSPSVDVSIGFGNVALGTINVPDLKDYATKDLLTVQAFKEHVKTADAVSLETTHGLIRAQVRDLAGDCPFLFVSGIVNRFGRFLTDVDPRADAQNTVGAHNAGVVVTWMLSSLDKED